MALKYLIDENVNPLYPNQIRRREPGIFIQVVGEPETPPKGTLDGKGYQSLMNAVLRSYVEHQKD